MPTPGPSLKRQLTALFSDAFVSLGFEAKWGETVLSDRPDLAQYQCNGALGCAKSQRKNPRELATQLVDQVSQAAQEKNFPIALSIAGPGFINITCGDELLTRFLNQKATDPRLGVPKRSAPRKVVVDYGGPNVAKSMHAGHLRSSILGYALVKIYRFCGDEVIGDNHLGDWGTPMGMLICELQREQPDLPYFDPNFTGPYPKESPVTIRDLERLYPIVSKKCKEDPDLQAQAVQATHELQSGRPGYRALWQHFRDVTVADQNADFEKIGVRFDLILGESFFEDKMPQMVDRLKASGITQVSEGALVIPLASQEKPDTPPLILVKSGGGFLYHTSDLATIEYRVNELKADLCIYAVDNRQRLHFEQVFQAARLTGIAGQTQLIHAGFGTMNGPDGKPFKTREGGVIKLKDLIALIEKAAWTRLQEVGIPDRLSKEICQEIAEKVGSATLKYADLKNVRTSDYVFDLDRFSQLEGNTGPYLQYAAVRIQSILKKAKELGMEPGPLLAPSTAVERTLYLESLKFPDVIDRAYDGCEPHHLCDYGFGLSQAFNSFYKECHILREEDPARRASWLGVCRLIHAELALILDLLGIEIPSQM